MYIYTHLVPMTPQPEASTGERFACDARACIIPTYTLYTQKGEHVAPAHCSPSLYALWPRIYTLFLTVFGALRFFFILFVILSFAILLYSPSLRVFFFIFRVAARFPFVFRDAYILTDTSEWCTYTHVIYM